MVILINVINTASTVDYTKGGDNWTGKCSSGELQSPLDIVEYSNTCENSMVLDIVYYNEMKDVTMDYTYALIINVPDGTSAADIYATDVDGNLYGYELESIIVHSPAEHKIDGDEFDVEVQLKGKLKDEYSSDYEYGIISLLFQENQESENVLQKTNLILIVNIILIRVVKPFLVVLKMQIGTYIKILQI
ncbi:Alpha carbonic anhydrase [Pseudocohnilembus persalinus]|uniref:Alpha carbonic anhydrase n=1 Tax=Pseudocohnilembus persalinus TaxID=266149 RepID=A0A0V0QJ17_PSEPJ|nr:Alpha carbonic anhydrase [Pseudocohnilembus persalinus]|eukprot:KRX02150.1 Alpha carbonic anhydrase [Pseudocohnilembus persalinus]